MEAAIERFLGKGTDAVVKTARQTLEGALRGAIAGVSPEAANAGRLDLAKQVTTAAREDLRQLGIVLDFFQIQEIDDSQGYLEAIGKKQAARVRRDAQIAEATAEAEARTVAAEQKKIGRDAEIANELVIIEKENALRVRQSELEKTANEASERAAVARDIARAEEQITLQTRRVQLAEKKVEAETIVPAKAAAEAERLAAEGHAAKIREDGKATAEAVELMRAQWCDGEAKELFLIRLLPELTDKVTRVVSENLQVDKLTIVDSGNGQGLPNYVNNLTSSAVVMMEQVKNATGVDLAKIADNRLQAGRPSERARVVSSQFSVLSCGGLWTPTRGHSRSRPHSEEDSERARGRPN